MFKPPDNENITTKITFSSDSINAKNIFTSESKTMTPDLVADARIRDFSYKVTGDVRIFLKNLFFK